MPKLLVVFSSVDSYAARIADAVAQGAKSVRFMEVDVRAVADAEADVSGRLRLDPLDAVREYDGVVLAGPGPESTGHELGALLERLATGLPLPDTVFGLAGEDNPAMLAAIAQSGGIIVGQPRTPNADECARKLGARIAKVIGWVRHGLSHEAEQSPSHHHHHGRAN